MAQGAIVIGWGATVAGHRQKALKVFDEALQFWARMQKAGEIDSFEPVLLDYHAGDLAGFLIIKGDREKLTRIRMSPEAETLNARASLVVHNFGVVEAFVGSEMQRRLGVTTKAVQELD